MKLFDRSVDLAQFTEDTPLYPICRAWMANQPRSTYNSLYVFFSLQVNVSNKIFKSTFFMLCFYLVDYYFLKTKLISTC